MKFLIRVELDDDKIKTSDESAWKGKKELLESLEKLVNDIRNSTSGSNYWVVTDDEENEILKARIDAEWQDNN